MSKRPRGKSTYDPNTPRFPKKKAKVNLANPKPGTGPTASRSEKKNLDIVTTATITFGQTTANVALLNAMAQGTTSATRVGRKVKFTSIQWRWQGSTSASSAGSTPIRMVLVYDKQTNGASAGAALVFATDTIDSPMNLNYSDRFIVLADVLKENLSSPASAGGDDSWYIKGYKELNLEGNYGLANNGNAGDIATGSILAYFWQNGNLLTASPTSTMYSRIRFVDM